MNAPFKKHLHELSAEEVLNALETSAASGLSAEEARLRELRYGPNALPMRREHGAFVTFLLQFHQPLVYILLATVVITAALQEWIDAGVILGVVLVNAAVGFVQEFRAAKALEALARMTVTTARVVRDGRIHSVSSLSLVPGDLVLLQSGDKVPADLRLIQSRDLQIDESTLTGESVPVEKNPATLPGETPLADRRNLAFSSTLVTYGQGRGVVFATGGATEVGRISDLVSSADILQTPLTRKIAGFSRALLVVILVFAVVTFLVGVLRGQTPVDMLMAAVSLAVGAIPEGLPAAVTITLAIGVKRMARQRAIIRKLPAVETLGSCTTICSDKTGTLTVNQMTVSALWAGNQSCTVTGIGYGPEGDLRSGEGLPAGSDLPAVRECLLAGLLCNDAALHEKADRWEVIGDPTEGALIVSARKAGFDPGVIAAQLPRLDSVPFESQHQYMATLHDAGAGQPRLVYAKGAVEVLLARCESALDREGRAAPLDRDAVLQQLDEMAASGLRVLAFARGEKPADATSLTHRDVAGLTFLGLQGMIDPPRAEAIQAVRVCQSAGIHVKMITGDHPVTARAIAEQLGLQGSRADDEAPLMVMTSRELAETSDEDLVAVADRIAVFARATPEQKLRLVRALQANQQVVAMTGDGVNDAPALKQADIGVAMGVGGTEVAKEAADMILTDDNFATIEAAVEEGRGVFDNLTKFIVWTLPTNAGEGLVILAAVFTGVALPLLPVQILWINMTTAVLLGLMLAFEPKEPDIMQRPPRDPRSPLLSPKLILRMSIVSLILLAGAFGSFDWALKQGFSDNAARTVAVNVFVMVEMFYLFNCRSLTKSMFALGLFSNRWIAVGVALMITLQLSFTYLPAMNRLFQSAPIGWDAWWRILATAVFVYLTVGVEKWMRRQYATRHPPTSA